MFEKVELTNRIFKSPELTRKLIRNRAEFVHYDREDNREWYNKTPISNNEKQIIEIYFQLDELIAGCRLNEENMTILELIQQGYTFRKMSEKMNINNSNISKRLNTICRNIVKEYELIICKEEAKRKNLYFKNCTKCNGRLPESAKFFSYDKSNQCYKSSCKKCRKG